MFVGSVGPMSPVVLSLAPAVSSAHSEGMKYLTPASMAALIKAMCLRSKRVPGAKELNTMTASLPVKFLTSY
jgi:hypothetical protein